METVEIIILILSSGFSGAIAGGVVSLFGQWLNRKWQKEDEFLLMKRKLYSEIIGVGDDFIGEEKYIKINNNVATALLFAENKLSNKLINYMRILAPLNSHIKANQNTTELKNYIKECSQRISKMHNEIVEIMREELRINNK